MKKVDLDMIQENSSVFTFPGKIISGPLKPSRNKTSNCIGIYDGEGRDWMVAISLAKYSMKIYQN